jgi:hypothetical protein
MQQFHIKTSVHHAISPNPRHMYYTATQKGTITIIIPMKDQASPPSPAARA